jgi:type IV secretion system protein VirD4
MLRASSFNLRDVLEGRPLSIFIVMPADKLESHKSLLRLLVGTLLTAVTRRSTIPPQRTLFLIDEAAQLGTLPALRQAVTLLRGSGLQVVSVWQDCSQLKMLYPQDWPTMVNNSAFIQAFGVNNHQMAKEWSELFGRPVSELTGMTPDQAIVQVQGQGCRICRRPDYLNDSLFAGLYDPNPRFAKQGKPGLPPGR